MSRLNWVLCRDASLSVSRSRRFNSMSRFRVLLGSPRNCCIKLCQSEKDILLSGNGSTDDSIFCMLVKVR